MMVISFTPLENKSMSHSVLHRALIGRSHLGTLAAIAATLPIEALESPLMRADPREPTQIPDGDLGDAAKKQKGEGDSPFNDADGDEDSDDRSSIRRVAGPNDPEDEQTNDEAASEDDDEDYEDDEDYDGDFE